VEPTPKASAPAPKESTNVSASAQLPERTAN